MKKLILPLTIFLLFGLEIKAQSVSKFISEKQVFMHETTETVVTDKTETEYVMVSIDWTNKKIGIDYKDGTSRDKQLPFVAHDVNKEAQTFTFYFNSKEIKVALFMATMSTLTIQYKDGKIANYIITKQL